MNRKTIIAALTARQIAFDPNATTAFLNVLLCRSWLTVRNAAEEGFTAGDDYDFELTINGQIGTDYYGDQGYSAKQFQDELKPFAGKKGLLTIHSGGGNVWDAFAIAELARAHGKLDTKILGLAASAADVIFQSGQTRFMPRMAMRMAHCASALFCLAGNAKELTAAKADLDKTITRLQKHDGTLAAMYAKRSGQSLEAVQADMEAEEFMDGDESLEKGYCDQLTDETPITDRLDLSHLKRVPANVCNQFSRGGDASSPSPSKFSAPVQGAAKPPATPTQNDIMRKQMEALLNEWGVNFNATDTDDAIMALVKAGKPKAAPSAAITAMLAVLASWSVPAPENATEEQLTALVKAGKPAAANDEGKQLIAELRAQRDNQRRETLRNRITQFASEDRIPVNQIEEWVTDAFSATDDPVKGNPILNRLAALEPKAPGVQPISIEFGEENLSLVKLDKVICDLMKPSQSIRGQSNPDNDVRKTIAARSRQISSLLNSQKKFDRTTDKNGILIGPLRDAWDKWASGVHNANTMSAGLLRQIILSEIMRAFRREFASLNLFCHNYKDVALQGTDTVDVPYYPLDTTASTEFVQATGYVITPNAVTSAKSIVVGGKADNVASPGVGRKYKPLGFSAYEINRQPWLNIAQLVVLAAEQLAIDVRGDILGANIKAANFGNAIWTGAAGAFNKDTFVQYLLNAAIKAYWPQNMRHAILTPDFYTALLSDPAFLNLNIGSTDPLRAGIVGDLVGFKDVTYDALLPIANFIRGGDGTVTAGADLNLAGFIAYPSAILLATAPIMPGPATMRLLASYEQVTDDQTGLTFSYQYGGNVLGSSDFEIIECSYGSGLGELAALKRITTAGA